MLFTVLVRCVNQEWGPKQVTMKYLKKGHSFMRADSVHRSISRKMRKNKMIYDFENFVSVCENASKRINPVIMHFDNFYQFVGGQKSRQSKSGTTLPKLAKVQYSFEKDPTRCGLKIP